jgi:hypothetical protein
MTPELSAAIADLVGAAQNAESGLNQMLEDSRTPYWILVIARRDAKALAEAVRAVEAAMKEMEK